MSLRKSSSSRNGSKYEVLPKPKARRRCTPAPSSVGLDLISRLMGRMDIVSISDERRSEGGTPGNSLIGTLPHPALVASRTCRPLLRLQGSDRDSPWLPLWRGVSVRGFFCPGCSLTTSQHPLTLTP